MRGTSADRHFSTEEVFQRDPTVPDGLGPVDPFALDLIFEDPTRIEDCFSLLHDWQVRIQIRSWKVIALT